MTDPSAIEILAIMAMAVGLGLLIARDFRRLP